MKNVKDMLHFELENHAWKKIDSDTPSNRVSSPVSRYADSSLATLELM